MTDELRVRPAAEDDAVLLLAWRNDPEARRWSRSSETIDMSTHRAWLLRTLASPDRHLLVVESADGTPVATARYDRLEADPSAWEVSISVSPDARGRGIGGRALRASDRWLLRAVATADRIVAHVRPTNVASRRLFERNGYGGVPSDEPDMLRFECRRDAAAPDLRRGPM